MMGLYANGKQIILLLGVIVLLGTVAAEARAQSLFERRSTNQIDQYRNYAARHQGDLLFVLINESTDVENRDERSLDKQGSSSQIQTVLETGQALALVGDQHAGPKGCWVDFLGRPASCHKAIGLFTLTSGAPLLVLAATRRGQPMQFDFEILGLADPEQDDPACANVTTLTQFYNDHLGAAIRAHPEQYWWIHRRWKGTPPKRKAARRQAA